MITKGIRGAITVDENSEEAVKSATLELLDEMMAINGLEKWQISHIIFTLTKDINAVFPAKFARLNYGLEETAMMCFNEIDVPNAMQKVLRILLVVNCENSFQPEFVYLKGTENLRS